MQGKKINYNYLYNFSNNYETSWMQIVYKTIKSLNFIMDVFTAILFVIVEYIWFNELMLGILIFGTI